MARPTNASKIAAQTTETVADNNLQSLRIEAFTFAEFCEKVQQAILDGYVFDFETNAGFPSAFIGNYSAGMIRVG